MEVKRADELTVQEVQQLAEQGCKIEPYEANGEKMLFIIYPMMPTNKD